jgi:hypothetical protein
MQSEDMQTELVLWKQTLITSLLHAKISSKAENCVVKVNPRPVNEVSEK